MPSTPEDFLTAATELKDGAREIDHRNAISRAYYSAFLTCRNFTGEIRRTSDDRGSHDAYINFFIKNRSMNDEADKLHIRIGHKLRNAKDLRTRADYNLDATCTDNDALRSIRFVEAITGLLNDITNRAKGTAEIKTDEVSLSLITTKE